MQCWRLAAAVLTSCALAGCPSRPIFRLDAGPDAPLDALDAPVTRDTGPDAPLDAAFDAGTDAGPDADLDATSEPDADLDADLDAPAPPDVPIDAARADAPAPPFDAAGCNTTVTEHPPVPSPHVAACSAVTYGSMPPTSGPHYPSWPAFGPYTTPIPWGFLVHALEHGAIVITYDCPSGCAADVSALLSYLDIRPEDPLCSRDVHHRVIVAPDPGSGLRFTASAWGWALSSDCFDLPALAAFIDAHYAMGPENLCADGVTGLTCDLDAGAPDGGT